MEWAAPPRHIRSCTLSLWRKRLCHVSQTHLRVLTDIRLTDLVLPLALLIDGDLLVGHAELFEGVERDRIATVVGLPLVTSVRQSQLMELALEALERLTGPRHRHMLAWRMMVVREAKNGFSSLRLVKERF